MNSELQEDSSNEEKDVKPIITSTVPSLSQTTTTSTSHAKQQKPLNLTANLNNSPKKWSPGSLQDGNRKSAFQPYRQSCCTVLTNLQRGNTQAETPIPQITDFDLHACAGQGEINDEILKNEPEIDVCDRNGLTPLHWAAAYGQYNAVELLLDNNASVDRPGPDGETPLIFAASGGHHEVIRLLISRGADVNRTDHLCNTPLMFAARGNHPHSCQELLIHGADFRLQNLNEDTAYTLAVDNSCTLAQAVITNFIISYLESDSYKDIGLT